MVNDVVRPHPGFRVQVERDLGRKVSPCFHCAKCSAGCPVTFAMDVLPHRVVRMIQLGIKQAVLESSTIWICASCETCSTRCPNEVDIARVMDVLRQTAIRERARVPDRTIPAFHAAFLASIRKRGRVHELSMLARFKLMTGRSGGLLRDVALGWEMFKRGKLKLLVPRMRGTREVRDIFRRSEPRTLAVAEDRTGT